MGLLKGIISLFSGGVSNNPSPDPKLVGNESAICPYCQSELEKFPCRKKKCPTCKEFIFVRTRPSDNKKILIREDQIIEVEELWSIKNGTHDNFLEDRRKFSKQKESLTSAIGREPTENEVNLELLNQELASYAKDYQWGLYRNAKLSIGTILKKEGKLEEALNLYLQVCYIDLNGPNNCCTHDPELLAEFPPFDLDDAFLAPGVVSYIDDIMHKMELNFKIVKARFVFESENLRNNLGLKADIEEAWEQIKSELI